MALREGAKLSELTQQEIAELQTILRRAGYDPGPIDGVLGPATQAAYNRFLGRNGFDQRGATTVVRLAATLASTSDPAVWQTVTSGGEVASATPTSASVIKAPTAPTATGTPAQVAPTYTAPIAAPVTDASTEQQVRTQYPHLAYLLDNPEVRDVLMRATQGAWDQATLQGELFKTAWWQQTSANTRVWDAKMAQDPATAMQEWDQRTVSVLNLSQQLGAPVDNEGAKWLAGRILREGWSDEQLRRFLGRVVRDSGGAAPGQITDQMAQLKALARSYMSTMSDADAQEFAVKIAEGSISREGVETMLRTEAKNRFSWLAPQIDAGLTPTDLFGSTRNAVAQQLEMDPNQIDLNDPRWSELTSPITDEKGQVRSMNFYEAQRWARQRSEWRFTDNANRTASDMTLNLLKSMGMVA